ncbi:MAG: DUF2207 domain-containing protein [Alphaproteobacteria bacterium]|nr:DUF2207 domain-containing protein [Alphaproteobacteria bacterium]
MRYLLFVLGLLLLVNTAAAEESILSYVSDVNVNRDGSLDVAETITVNAEGDQIRRGIYRDFPTTYIDRNGIRMRVGFDVVGVKRDGHDEPFAIESLSNGKRVRIGDKDVFLDPGQHTYEINFRTTRQIGFFENFDELYWNVTGNDWAFPILHAVAIVRLPPGARIQQHAAYTGRQGEAGQDFSVVGATGAEYRAETTRRLERQEGFTIAVAWQKGIVAEPSDSEKWSWWFADNAGLAALIGVLAAAFAYYYYAWDRVGRDPPRGTIVPLFRPPAGLGPAGARFVREHGLDDRGFAAALVSLAVKRHLLIKDDDRSFAITKQSPKGGAGEPLTAAERALYARLPGGTTVLKQSNHVAVRAARSALKDMLKSEYEGSVFVRNLGWFWKGAAISIIGLIIAAVLLPADEGIAGLFLVGWSGIWWGVVLTFAWAAIKGIRGGRGIIDRAGSLFMLLFLIPFVGGGLAAPAMLLSGAGSAGLYMLIGTAILLGIMNLVFFHLLRAPTVPGRKLLDELEGFRMYMTTAEEERLKVLHPPEKTPELFERYLPYALALDCENEWNAKFATVLAAAAAAGAAGPSWYSGRHWDAGRTGGFTDSLGRSLSSSVASASTAPGKSSGSSGGGSSGGGGGGGGGGGW